MSTPLMGPNGKWHPIYRAWVMMRQRCRNPRRKGFEDYGGRGIGICDAWESFDQFLQDIGPAWQLGLTLDRINTDGNYEPGNCRWASRQVQVINRRKQKNNSSGFRGVTWRKHEHRWQAQIQCAGKNIYIGCFDTAEGAARAYDAEALKRFGTEAHPNFNESNL